MEITDGKPIRVEMDEATLLRLLAGGQVCAADFRCLDCESKRCLWRLCLLSCATQDENERVCSQPCGCRNWNRTGLRMPHRTSGEKTA